MKCKKVLLALTLSLCALLCMVVTASADGHENHPICGATHTDIGDHKGPCENVTWQSWDGTFEDTYGQATGFTYDDNDTAYIYLTHDVVRTRYNDNNTPADKSAGLIIPEGKHLYLCLNGHTITKNANDTNITDWYGVINCGKNASLTLCDCKGNGNITHASGKTGNGVSVQSRATFTMYGGTITGNTIKDNHGGGVCVASGGAFTMYGGIITDNTTDVGWDGGGVCSYGGDFTMYGGTIEKNNAGGYGGGVCLVNATANISGGTIADNKAAKNGGGMYLSISSLSKAANFSGDIRITGNQASCQKVADGSLGTGTSSNLYLNNSEYAYSYLTITGALTGGDASIGVTSAKTPADATDGYINIAKVSKNNWENVKGTLSAITYDVDNTNIYQYTTGADGNFLRLCAHKTASTGYKHDEDQHWQLCATCDDGIVGEKKTHTYGSVSYIWAEDNASCTATRTCTTCKYDQSETVTATPDVTQQQSCELPEKTTYEATFTNTAFATQKKENIVTKQALGHTYGDEVSYTWATGHTSCTAKRVCIRDKNHVEAETTTAITSQVTQERSCTDDELTTFTATFKNSAFGTREDVNVTTQNMTGHSYGTPTYVWTENNTKCTATRVCANDTSHVDTAEGTVTSKVTQNQSCTDPEITTYTATFATNTDFVTQTTTKQTQAALQHHMVEQSAKPATCTENGYEAYQKCDREGCDHKEGYTVINALGHKYEWAHDGDQHWEECTVCKDIKDNKKAEHKWKDATYTAPQTCETCGTTHGNPRPRPYYGPTITAVRNGPNKSATDYPGGEYGLIFRSTASYATFQGVQVDGKTLAKGSYTVEAYGSSTEVYLKTAYLKTLSAGSHTVTLLSTAGNVSMGFTVGSTTVSPTTFDAGIGVYAVTALLSLGGMAYVGRKRR